MDEIRTKEPFYALIAKSMLNQLKGNLEKQKPLWQKLVSAALTPVAIYNRDIFSDLIFRIITVSPGSVTVLSRGEWQDLNKNIDAAIVAFLSILVFTCIYLAIDWLTNLLFPVDMEKKRARLESKLRRSSTQRIVVIDDVDRLPDDELQELFRVIKSVAAMPNMVYIILYDREIVSDALNKLHADRGEQFLEKIVQIPNRLPTPTAHAKKMALRNILQSLPEFKNLFLQESMSQQQEDGLALISKAFILNIRQAKRILDAFRLNYKKGLAIDALLFIFLEAFRINNPEMCIKLCHAMTDYANHPIGTSSIHNKEDGVWSEKEKEWMVKHGFINDQGELISPFATTRIELIECLSYFTGLTLSSKVEQVGGHFGSPFCFPHHPDTLRQKDHISKAFLNYLQARFSEEQLSFQNIEENLFSLTCAADFTQFILDRQLKFHVQGISGHDITFYIKNLNPDEIFSRLDQLHRLAKMAAASAESVYNGNTDIAQPDSFLSSCKEVYSSFGYGVSYAFRTKTGIADEAINKWKAKEKQLNQAIRKDTPLFNFAQYERNIPGDSKDLIPQKSNILIKYSHNHKQVLQVLLEKNLKHPGRKIFGITLLNTGSDDQEKIITEWLSHLTTRDQALDELLKNWIVASLKYEEKHSRLPHQPKLQYLITQLQYELREKKEEYLLSILNHILQQTPSAN